MIGLGFLLLFVSWGVGCAVVSWLLSKLFPSPWRPWVGLVLFVVLTPTLLIDEVIGKRQFERLCQEQTVYIAPNAKGRTVYLLPTTFEPIKGIWLHGWIQKWRYVDEKTKETVVSYNLMHWDGGWFMRAIKWNGMSAPLLYKSSCDPEKYLAGKDNFKDQGMILIDRP